MPERVVFNPGPLVVQVHTAAGVRRVDAGARATIPADPGPTGDHLRALLRSGALRDEGTAETTRKTATKRSAPQPAPRKRPATKTSAQQAAAGSGPRAKKARAARPTGPG